MCEYGAWYITVQHDLAIVYISTIILVVANVTENSDMSRQKGLMLSTFSLATSRLSFTVLPARIVTWPVILLSTPSFPRFPLVTAIVPSQRWVLPFLYLTLGSSLAVIRAFKCTITIMGRLHRLCSTCPLPDPVRGPSLSPPGGLILSVHFREIFVFQKLHYFFFMLAPLYVFYLT